MPSSLAADDSWASAVQSIMRPTKAEASRWGQPSQCRGRIRSCPASNRSSSRA